MKLFTPWDIWTPKYIYLSSHRFSFLGRRRSDGTFPEYNYMNQKKNSSPLSAGEFQN